MCHKGMSINFNNFVYVTPEFPRAVVKPALFSQHKSRTGKGLLHLNIRSVLQHLKSDHVKIQMLLVLSRAVAAALPRRGMVAKGGTALHNCRCEVATECLNPHDSSWQFTVYPLWPQCGQWCCPYFCWNPMYLCCSSTDLLWTKLNKLQ